MIHDATGKFSSRWVLPDRSSLALVIKNWLHSLETVVSHAALLARMPRDREPHIGEYVAKTNAICDFSPGPRRSNQASNGPAAATNGCRLLAVVFQHLIAGLGQLGTILLQASQNGEITLIHQLAAEALDVACAGLLLLRRAAALLGDGTGGNRDRQQGECQEKFMHRVPSF
jgi:hypothetical protein